MAFGPLNFQRVPLLTAESADETTSTPINCLGYTALTFYVTGTGTTSSGVITFEEADLNPNFAASAPYTGTWSAIGTVDLSSTTLANSQYAYHVGGPGGVYSFSHVRARISTVIGGGGTVSVVLVAV